MTKTASTKHPSYAKASAGRQAPKNSRFGFRISNFVLPRPRGYTLVELIIAVGLFALVMTLASGAYLMMIAFSRQTQSTITGINNLSFALESLTRTIRTGIDYNCGGTGDCPSGASTFSLTDENGVTVSYALSGSAIQATVDGVAGALTEPSVTVTSMKFYAFGTPRGSGDRRQSRVTIIVSGTVSAGPGKPLQAFTAETGATMRGTDI